ncbi:MAG: choice-of-anchor D domain-containing protein [Saprospiraceae bacterium]|nr:choice-of-anchor D domain-containing protein [Saprospiraceae bacterium]
MTDKLKYFLFLFLCFATLTTQAQLYVQATAYTDAVTLTFFPLNPATWSQNTQAGYRVERVETADGVELPATRTVLAERLLPQYPLWFSQNKQLEDGVMEAIGALLYDTSFQFSDKTLLDGDSMRWNYIMHEVATRPWVALATGSMLIDSVAVPGKSYRYRISAPTVPGMNASIDIKYERGQTAQVPADVQLSFRFPENRSLTDMLPKVEKPVFPQVFALAKSYGDSIMVRWAPSSAELWNKSLTQGYLLTRWEDLPPGSDALRTVDTLGIFKPWEKERVMRWAEGGGSDSMALLAAGILYNEEEGEMGPVTEQGQVFETRYGFAVFAAEGSQLAAKMLGLGFADKNVRPGKTYNYQVVALEAPGQYSRAQLRIKNEVVAAPKPVSFEAISKDHLIHLVWEIPGNVKHFSAYEIERSGDNGKAWQKLHDNPLTFVSNDVAPISNYQFLDSVAVNYKKFRYRLRGLDSFGDWSPWTELEAQAVDLTPPPMAGIVSAAYNDTTNIATIRWEVDPLPDDFKAFYLLLGTDANGLYDTLAVLKNELREYAWKPDSLLSGNRAYFWRVLTMDIHGNAERSPELFMSVPDLIPPPPPARVVGHIEDDGTVTVVWEHSTAKDLIGYWVYAANNVEQEFPILNKTILTDNSYSWSVADRSLNDYLYVVVSAEDSHNNRGEVSEVLRLKRPDKVPPIVPQMISAKQDTAGVRLQWKPSVSEDCRQYLVLRRKTSGQSLGWELRDSVGFRLDHFTDTTCQIGGMYQYAVLAVDDSGNRSDTSNAVDVKTRFLAAWAPVKKLVASQTTPDVASVRLTWSFQPPLNAHLPEGEHEFLLFRSTGNDNPEFLTTVPGSQREYEDTDVLNGVVYNYTMQARFKEGNKTGRRSNVASVLTQGSNPVLPEKQKTAGTAPAKLVLRGKGLAIQNGDDSPTLEDETDFGRVGTGSVVGHKFALQNTGEMELEIPSQPISLEGNDLSVWAIVQPKKTKVKGYGSAEYFTIEFRPKAEGEYTARVKVAGNQPISFTVKGTGTRKPELDVQGNGLTILNKDNTPTPDDNTDFGGVATGTKATQIFTVKNIGVDPLRVVKAPVLNGSPAFAISNFKQPKGNVIAAGSDLPLFVTFQPMQTGVHSAKLTIFTDDEDENPFVVTLQGVGAGPEVSILGESENTIADGSSGKQNDTNFGEVTTGLPVVKSFIIKNLGDRSLNLTGRPRVAISGANAADFKLVKDPAPQVKPGGGEEVFTIEFRPKAAGLRQAVITVENNDANEGSYQFTIQGTGL